MGMKIPTFRVTAVFYEIIWPLTAACERAVGQAWVTGDTIGCHHSPGCRHKEGVELVKLVRLAAEGFPGILQHQGLILAALRALGQCWDFLATFQEGLGWKISWTGQVQLLLL